MLQVNIATNLTICDEVSDDDDRLRVVTDGRARAREFLHWAPNFYAPAAGYAVHSLQRASCFRLVRPVVCPVPTSARPQGKPRCP